MAKPIPPNEVAIVFLASFPPIGSAVKVSGNGDGMRITLDIPETEMSKAVMLLAVREKRLKVTIEVEENGRKART